jgi:nucleotide-binding universal stress UspA family protein
MRVLVAYDGSAGAELAASFVLGGRWPDGSSARVVAVIEPTAALDPSMPGAPSRLTSSPELEAEIQEYLAAEVDAPVGRRRAAGLEADGGVARGRPASVLVDEARQSAADLVVIGSRGHGPIASLVLGSVSAEVVDHAPCPVVVARDARHDRVLFATDGSVSAEDAESLIDEWPIFDGTTIRVLSVAEDIRPWHTGVAPTMVRQVAAAHAEELQKAKAAHEVLVHETAERLTAAGRAADAALRVGDAAAEIVAEAESWGADLVVMGSRGRTGLTRILLGSVARNVLQGSRSSVLIVRDRSRDGSPPS